MIGKNKQGVYFYSIYFIDSFGVRKQKKVENKEWKTKKEVQRQLDLFLISLNGKTERVTVGHLFDLYFTHKKDKLKLRSQSTVKSAYENHIEPTFSKMVVEDITNKDIITWQRSLLNQGYKNRYLDKVQALLRSILVFGVNYSYTSKNPFTIEILRNRDEVKREMLYWSNDEFNKFINYVDEKVYEVFFKMLYFSGLRLGEAQALLLSDIDFIKGTVNVNKSYDVLHHVITTPKTHSSYRIVTLTESVLRALDELKQEYQQIDGYSENVILFGFNKRLHPDTIKRKQVQACELAKVKIIRLHDMRHSHVSLLINLGFSPFEIAKRLGHSVDMVNNVYGHLFPERDRVMVDRLNELQLENTQKSLKN
jgi:integrase